MTLVERLRDAASRIGYYNGKGQWESGEAGVVAEAADRIEELEGQLHLCPTCGASCKECVCTEARIVALQEALRRAEQAKQ